MAWIQSIPYSNDKGWWHYHKRWLDESIDEFTAQRTVRRTGSAPCCWRHDLKSRTCPWILSPPPSCSLLSPSFDSWRFEVPLSQSNGVNQRHSKIFETISQHSGFKLIFSDILSQQQKVTNMVQKKKNHSVGNRNQKWPTDSNAGVCVSALRGVCTKLCSPPKFVLLQGTVYLCKLLEMIVKARSHLEHRFLCMHTYGYKCICTNVGAHQILEPSKLRRYLLKRQGMFAFARDLKQTGWVTGRHVKEAKLKPPSLVF